MWFQQKVVYLAVFRLSRSSDSGQNSETAGGMATRQYRSISHLQRQRDDRRLKLDDWNSTCINMIYIKIKSAIFLNKKYACWVHAVVLTQVFSCLWATIIGRTVMKQCGHGDIIEFCRNFVDIINVWSLLATRAKNTLQSAHTAAHHRTLQPYLTAAPYSYVIFHTRRALSNEKVQWNALHHK